MGCVDTAQCQYYGVSAIDIEEISVINIYPNPISDFVNIELPGNENYSIQLLSLDGKNLKTIISAKETEILHLSGLNSGIYLIRISTSENIQVFKIVKE